MYKSKKIENKLDFNPRKNGALQGLCYHSGETSQAKVALSKTRANGPEHLALIKKRYKVRPGEFTGGKHWRDGN